jgi:aldehyde dehydrogenase (NAD+)
MTEMRKDKQMIEQIPSIVRDLRDIFHTGRTRALEWRLEQLQGIERMALEHEAEIKKALALDMGKPELEAHISELVYLRSEIKMVRKNLKSWLKPERVSTPIFLQPAVSRIYREPLGLVLIIGPWNYPFQLVMLPLVGAIAAGNCAIVKPSEVSEHTSNLIARLLPMYVDKECIRVVEGGVPETTALLAEKFDHIFYTGNGHVGRIVMSAAAKHLTPVTLELGGQSPAIVDREADLQVAARRIIWGKYFNAGQTCVAPNHLLVHEDIYEQFIEMLGRVIGEFYGEDPRLSPDYARIINQRHFERLLKLIEGANIAFGGKHDVSARYIAPTIIRDATPDAPLMREEIFGPILPVLKITSIDEAISIVNAGDKPLALYIFSANSDVQQRVIQQTSSGGAAINHIWMHLTVPELPFGGVGESGMGAYHGRFSFETFSHRKSVLKKLTSLDPRVVYPPYTEWKQSLLKHFL